MSARSPVESISASDGSTDDDWTDRLGHGTAVAAAIREKAPNAELLAVRVFERTLATNARILARAIAWSAEQGVDFVNLSLGTPNAEHVPELLQAVEDARRRGVTVVSAARHNDADWYPGSLPGTVGVLLDWDCPRDGLRVVESTPTQESLRRLRISAPDSRRATGPQSQGNQLRRGQCDRLPGAGPGARRVS